MDSAAADYVTGGVLAVNGGAYTDGGKGGSNAFAVTDLPDFTQESPGKLIHCATRSVHRVT
jgi:hypothetical protein